MIICIPTLRRYDLLRRLLCSLAISEEQPDAVYVLDNGRDTEKVNEAVDGFDFPIVVETPEQNLGVAGSWNWFIQNVPASEWLITNDDMTFAPQTIASMRKAEGDLVFGYGFSCYLIRRSCVEKLGLFDETISPNYAYFEDCDYMERSHASGVAVFANAENTGLIHGDGKDGSATWRAGNPEELADHHRRFEIARQNFIRKWGAEPQVLEARRARRADIAAGSMPRLLWVGDAACPSGFARATHEILDTLKNTYDVTVLGLNYNADPHAYPYPIYACFPGGDTLGFGRIVWMADRVKPDVIVLQNDGWNIPFYMQELAKRHRHIPVIAALAVDAKNFNGAWLKGISHAIFWTQFAHDEARIGGYTGPATVIPLGVDTTAYHPTDKRQARQARKLDQIIDAFIIGNVNRNQTRKRWDLTIKYFAEWVYGGMPIAERQMDDPKNGTTSNKVVNDAWLYLHTAPTGDEGVDVVSLARYYRIGDRLALMTPDTFYGITEEQMRDTYNSFDVQITTTLGEGFGFTTFEGAACSVAQIAPRWSALGELFDGAALLVPCTSTALSATHSGTIGGVADEALFIEALDLLYHDRIERTRLGSHALARAHEARFQWAAIGRRYVETLGAVLGGRGPARSDERSEERAKPLSEPIAAPTEAEWTDLGRPEVEGAPA